MSDFRRNVFATAAACLAIGLFAYADWFHHEAVFDAVMVGAMFILFAIVCLVCAAFVLITVGSVALSLWFALEGCCRWVWGRIRRWRVRP